MQLIEGWPSHLPMRFLVEIAQRHGIGEQKIQLLSHFQPHRLFQLEWQSMRDSAVRLNLAGMLMNARLCADRGLTGDGNRFLRHNGFSFFPEVSLPEVVQTQTA